MRSWLHISLNDEEMRALLEFAKQEDMEATIALKWCVKEGLKSFNGHGQTHLPATRLHGDDRKEE